jgi:hypothetical protein
VTSSKGTLIEVFERLKIFPDVGDIERRVAAAKRENGGSTPRDLAKRTISGTTRKLTGIGVVAALPGAIPGLGTAAQAGLTGGSVTGETWTILRNLTAMQLTVAGLYGHDVRHPDRRDEVLIVWGLQSGAIVPATEATKRIGTKIAIKQFNQHVSGAVFRRINQKVGTTVVTKWGAKRGGIAVGRLIPLGIGTVVGGGMNYVTARGYGAALMKYYDELLPADAEVYIAA